MIKHFINGSKDEMVFLFLKNMFDDPYTELKQHMINCKFWSRCFIHIIRGRNSKEYKKMPWKTMWFTIDNEIRGLLL